MGVKEQIIRFGDFLKGDSWQSWIVSVVIAVLVIRFILFPSFSVITSSSLPIVIIESCSMHHSSDFSDWWEKNAAWYESHNISKEDFSSFKYTNGLNKGDIVFVWGRGQTSKGDVIIYNAGKGATAKYPIIHRIVKEDPRGTKGDNNVAQLTPSNNNQRIDEINIADEQIIGKAVGRIPFIGWVKLVFFEPMKDASQRGFCH